MSHAHLHRHAKRDFISDIESFFGVGGGNSSPDQQTVTAPVVYVTASPTFTGAIGGYVTGTQPLDTPAESTSTAGKGNPVAQSTTHTTTIPHSDKTTTTTKAPETTTHAPSTTSTTSTQSTQSTTSTTSLSDLLTTTTEPPQTTFLTSSSTQSQSSTTSSTGTVLDQFPSPTASATTSAAASASNGLTGGAKAGIAIGVLFGVGVIAGLVLFWLHKQRMNREEAAAAAAAAENEKFTPSQPPPMTSAPPPQSIAAYSTSPTSQTAPQVSLRPITQFNPLFNQPAGANPYIAGAAGSAGAAAAGLQVNQPAERPYNGSAHVPPQSPRQDPFTDPVNPFDNGAQAPSPPLPPAKDASSPVRDLTPSPTGSTHNLPSPVTEEGPSPGSAEAGAVGAVAEAAVGAAAVAAVAAAKSEDKPAEPRTPSPEYVEGTGSRPQSPVVGGASVVSNVHRVQMDFTPSLADEMELRAGQLVRLLKSYDDGWTQCSSMDGSVKGIAPRTCLSARPLQPRRPPGSGGPNGPGPRGPPVMGPNGLNGRPMSPAGSGMGPPPQMRGAPPRFYNDGRPMTPTGSGMPQFPPPPGTPRSMSPGPGRGSIDVPRPLTPGGSRPASPAGGRSRSNSASVAQTGGRPPVHRGSQSPLAPPTGPLPGPPAQPVQTPTGPPAPPQVQVNGRPESPIERKPVPGQQ
ncbi:SH3 domain protein [Talaromyces stipitatus ATCC 10500]|uniref:SH3 domain protein n=1 Tax=Talaromyces stipitatus (strain ATCC 10500 / CBS 375.48 / QM 6759 / NRRL 1006) TaxID=441959 RepID=B8M226_TALSN|nr:SH3 domain protein [Talaromyces stipitatus ATCC 10500]EED21490.1 SH3 domain protein [Talaromyces stipitatus ATCC 10500]